MDYIEINGTIVQGTSDAPEHYRYWDGLTIATTIEEVAAYMSDPTGEPTSDLSSYLGLASASISKVHGVAIGSLSKIDGISLG
jgi:hypothetical protein